MAGFRPHPSRWAGLLLVSAAAFLAGSAARAALITDYITVQPIDVCSGAAGTTTGCAPINSLGQNYKTAAVGNIGALDVTASGDINVTRATWNQIGVDVTFLPAVQYANAGGFLTVSVDSCAANGTDCQSTQFRALSQQPGIAGNPPPKIPPTPPLSTNPSTVNTFFINHLNPPASQPGTLYGLSWIDNNGVAIASNALLGLGQRPDTLAHELGHDLDLDHNTFGAGGANNLLTAGNARTLPTSGANAISQLAAGTADQLNTTQQSPQVLLSGFLNPIPNVNTPITDPPHQNDFTVAFTGGGRPNEKLDTLTLTGPAGFLFSDDTRFSLLKNPDHLTVSASSFEKCGESGCASLVIDFTGGTPFVAGDSIDYSLCVKGDRSCSPIAIDNLAGGTYTYNFETDNSDGTPVELFQTTSELTGSGETLFSNSQEPDLLVPSEILNPTTFAGFSTEPCTTIEPDTCPTLTLEDGSPIEEDPAVPEPSTILILLTGLGVLLVVGRRQRTV